MCSCFPFGVITMTALFLYSPPNRDKGQRHWDDLSTQSQGLHSLEESRSTHIDISLKDSGVNFWLGLEGLQTKVDYTVDPPSLTQSIGPSDGPPCLCTLFTMLCMGTRRLSA